MAGVTGKEACEALSRYVNSTCTDKKEFVDAVLSEHRTLQQQMFECFLLCMQRWAMNYDKGQGWYDLRNQAACEQSKRIMKAVDDVVAVPFI